MDRQAHSGVTASPSHGQRCPLSLAGARLGKELILIALQRLRLQLTQSGNDRKQLEGRAIELQSYSKQPRENSETNFKQQSDTSLQ